MRYMFLMSNKIIVRLILYIACKFTLNIIFDVKHPWLNNAKLNFINNLKQLKFKSY